MGREISPETDKDLHPYLESGQVETRPPGTPWRDFLRLMQLSRALFVPNIHDASPRCLLIGFSEAVLSSGWDRCTLQKPARGQPPAG